MSPGSYGNIVTHLPHLCPLLCGDPGSGASVDVQHHLAEHQMQCLPMQHLPWGKQLQGERCGGEMKGDTRTIWNGRRREDEIKGKDM